MTKRAYTRDFEPIPFAIYEDDIVVDSEWIEKDASYRLRIQSLLNNRNARIAHCKVFVKP